MRLFIAIDLSDQMRAALQLQMDRLNSIVGNRQARWLDPAGIHLTLKFLGETPSDRMNAISGLLQRIATQYSPFAMNAGSFGCFPSWKKPSVLWIGVDEPTHTLAKLRNALEEALHALGHPQEARAFRPHLTIGRIRKGIARAEMNELVNQLEKVQIDLVGRQEVSEFCLFRSELHPHGAVYTKLGVYPLGRAG